MGLRIKTNMPSQIAIRQLDENRKSLDKSLERLSSGLRINHSSDDAAGLAISERMIAKMKSMDQAKRNANDGVSFLQVAEGGLGQLNNVLIRMRELTTQAASDTIGSKERDYINREFVQLGQEIIRIKDQTEFNGRRMLTQSDQEDIVIQVGVNFKGDDDGKFDASDVVKINFGDIETLNDAFESISSLSITGQDSQHLDGGTPDEIFSKLDSTLDIITSTRATLGATQSRLNETMTSIDIGKENINSAQSRIRDVDYAAESAHFAQARILSTAGTAVLSQANQLANDVLTLLR